MSADERAKLPTIRLRMTLRRSRNDSRNSHEQYIYTTKIFGEQEPVRLRSDTAPKLKLGSSARESLGRDPWDFARRCISILKINLEKPIKTSRYPNYRE